MNETMESIRNRFSCRKFSNKPVDDNIIQEILETAKYAANGKNLQGWHFTVIRTKEGKEILTKAAGKTPPPFISSDKPWPVQGDFCGAPVVILISGDPDVPWPEVGPVLAAGNIMISEASLGLATLWSSVFTRDLFRDEEAASVKAELIPDGYNVKAALFLGYPEQIPAARPLRKENVETWL